LIELAKQAIYRSQGSEALALAEEAQKIYRSMGANAPNIEMANAMTGIGHSLKELNRVEEAVKALDGAIELLREGSYPFVVDSLRTKASWLVEAGQYESAVETFLEAIQANEIDGEGEFFARDLLALSFCYSKMSRWQEVIEHAMRARENFKREKLVDEVAWCDVQVAIAYAELGNSEFALDIGTRAYHLGDLRNHLAIKCHAAFVIGKALGINSQFEEAERRLQEAREIVSGSNDWEMVTRVEREFINLYLAQGKVEAADEVERRLKSLQEVVE